MALSPVNGSVAGSATVAVVVALALIVVVCALVAAEPRVRLPCFAFASTGRAAAERRGHAVS